MQSGPLSPDVALVQQAYSARDTSQEKSQSREGAGDEATGFPPARFKSRLLWDYVAISSEM